jgi:4-diphosphocytidyl-2C-methyl-D-erythritol kinase
MNKIRLRANGKINLGLDVISKRIDGYHELRMIMQTINICDYVTIKKKKTKGIKVYSNVGSIPCNEKNLAYKAAKIIMEEYNINTNISIHIQKNIPVAAGMAGGSADAAAVLRGMNIMFNLGLTYEELEKQGLKIGADVPYCIRGGAKLAEGIGEILTFVEQNLKPYVLIAKPDISLSTAYVYNNLKCDEIIHRPKIDKIIEMMKIGNLWEISENMGNVLEIAAIPNNPIIQKIKDSLIKSGACAAMMSGSGPTVFGLFCTYEEARLAEIKLKKKQMVKQTYITRFTKGIQ